MTYAIKTTQDSVVVRSGETAVLRFSVFNDSDQPRTTAVQLACHGAVQREWCRVEPDGDVELQPRETRLYEVSLRPVGVVQPVSGRLVLEAAWVSRPNSVFGRSPEVTTTFVEAKAPSTTRIRIPWLLIAAVAGGVLVLTGLVWLIAALAGGGGGSGGRLAGLAERPAEPTITFVAARTGDLPDLLARARQAIGPGFEGPFDDAARSMRDSYGIDPRDPQALRTIGLDPDGAISASLVRATEGSGWVVSVGALGGGHQAVAFAQQQQFVHGNGVFDRNATWAAVGDEVRVVMPWFGQQTAAVSAAWATAVASGVRLINEPTVAALIDAGPATTDVALFFRLNESVETTPYDPHVEFLLAQRFDPSARIEMIKALRERFGLGLAEAAAAVDNSGIVDGRIQDLAVVRELAIAVGGNEAAVALHVVGVPMFDVSVLPAGDPTEVVHRLMEPDLLVVLNAAAPWEFVQALHRASGTGIGFDAEAWFRQREIGPMLAALPDLHSGYVGLAAYGDALDSWLMFNAIEDSTAATERVAAGALALGLAEEPVPLPGVRLWSGTDHAAFMRPRSTPGATPPNFRWLLGIADGHLFFGTAEREIRAALAGSDRNDLDLPVDAAYAFSLTPRRLAGDGEGSIRAARHLGGRLVGSIRVEPQMLVLRTSRTGATSDSGLLAELLGMLIVRSAD